MKMGKAAVLSAAVAGIIVLSQAAHATGAVPAPEFDPSSAFAALTLLSGVLVAVRGRKAGKK